MNLNLGGCIQNPKFAFYHLGLIIIEILSYSKSILGLDIIDSVASLVQLYKVKTNLNFKKTFQKSLWNLMALNLSDSQLDLN